MKKRLMIAGITAAAVLIILAGTYLGIGIHYQTHFFEHTFINGIDVSDMTVEEAEEAIAERVENYQITLKERGDVRETIPGEQIGYHFVSGGEVQELLERQNILLWMPRYLGNDVNYTMEAGTEYDEQLLRQVMLELDCFNESLVTAPVDAVLSQKEDGTYQIIPENEGNQLKQDQVYQLLCRAADTAGTEIDLEQEECYEKPAVYSEDEDLKEQAEVLNRYAVMNVTYYMGGDVTVTLDSDTISSWLTLDENNQPVFDYETVKDYVAQLAADYDTIGTWEPFVTSLGETVYVEARTYGWQINQEQETEELYQLLVAGQSAERSPVYYESAHTRGENDLGATYVEIDYTNQRMWYYKDGALIVDTPIVSGCVANGTESPEGIFCLVGKSEDEVLRGEGYETPVEYWMPFYGGVGIHDADSWRGSSYGGTIYQTSGSHGCINTPTANAAVIYASIEIGTPIVCYKAAIYTGSSPSGAGGSSLASGSGDSGQSGVEILDNGGAAGGTGSSDEIVIDGGENAEGDGEDWADESTYWQ